jgi:lipopolysaccharide biosynthesis glycosyltransferase
MGAKLAVCYVADLNFLIGALVSLRSFRQFVPASAAEVYVFYLDPDPVVAKRVQIALGKFSATLVPLDMKSQIDLSDKSWNRTHVPHSALGRFYIEPHLPAHIERILYIDGDTLFVRDPGKLVEFVPPVDGFAAAEDIGYFARNDWGRFGDETRAYLAGLGIDGSKGYFNSGLLLAGRRAWRSVVADAAAFFDKHSDRCKYHDQSALNAVVGARRVRLSPVWNFQTPFCYWNIREQLQPCIYHFTEFPKPWMGSVVPWKFLEQETKQALAEFAELPLPVHTLSSAEVEKYDALKRSRARRMVSRTPLRMFLRQREMRRLIASHGPIA